MGDLLFSPDDLIQDPSHRFKDKAFFGTYSSNRPWLSPERLRLHESSSLQYDSSVVARTHPLPTDSGRSTPSGPLNRACSVSSSIGRFTALPHGASGDVVRYFSSIVDSSAWDENEKELMVSSMRHACNNPAARAALLDRVGTALSPPRYVGAAVQADGHTVHADAQTVPPVLVHRGAQKGFHDADKEFVGSEVGSISSGEEDDTFELTSGCGSGRWPPPDAGGCAFPSVDAEMIAEYGPLLGSYGVSQQVVHKEAVETSPTDIPEVDVAPRSPDQSCALHGPFTRIRSLLTRSDSAAAREVLTRRIVNALRSHLARRKMESAALESQTGIVGEIVHATMLASVVEEEAAARARLVREHAGIAVGFAMTADALLDRLVRSHLSVTASEKLHSTYDDWQRRVARRRAARELSDNALAQLAAAPTGAAAADSPPSRLRSPTGGALSPDQAGVRGASLSGGPSDATSMSTHIPMSENTSADQADADTCCEPMSLHTSRLSAVADRMKAIAEASKPVPEARAPQPTDGNSSAPQSTDTHPTEPHVPASVVSPPETFTSDIGHYMRCRTEPLPSDSPPPADLIVDTGRASDIDTFLASMSSSSRFVVPDDTFCEIIPPLPSACQSAVHENDGRDTTSSQPPAPASYYAAPVERTQPPPSPRPSHRGPPSLPVQRKYASIHAPAVFNTIPEVVSPSRDHSRIPFSSARSRQSTTSRPAHRSTPVASASNTSGSASSVEKQEDGAPLDMYRRIVKMVISAVHPESGGAASSASQAQSDGRCNISSSVERNDAAQRALELLKRLPVLEQLNSSNTGRAAPSPAAAHVERTACPVPGFSNSNLRPFSPPDGAPPDIHRGWEFLSSTPPAQGKFPRLPYRGVTPTFETRAQSPSLTARGRFSRAGVLSQSRERSGSASNARTVGDLSQSRERSGSATNARTVPRRPNSRSASRPDDHQRRSLGSAARHQIVAAQRRFI